MPSTIQNEWLERVLGVAPSGGTNPQPSGPRPNGSGADGESRGANRIQALRAALAALADPAYADAAALTVLQAEREKARAAMAPAQPTTEQQAAAEQALAAFAAKASAERVRVADRRSALLVELGRLDDPDGADPDELKAMAAERNAATAALAAATPVPADLDKADSAIATLRDLIGRAGRLATMAKTRPQAAAAARAAFKQFDAELGNAPVNDDMIAAAQRATATAQVALDGAEKDLRDAQAMPAGTVQQQAARKAAIRRAQGAREAALGKRDVAAKRENAAFGQKSLDAALRHGPLSPETARPFGDDVSTQLIAGYAKDSRLTQGAVEAAGTARYPGAIAGALDGMIDRQKGGFRAANGDSHTGPALGGGYAANVLRMAGNVGPDYMSGFDAYITSGRQFVPDPLRDIVKDSTGRLKHPTSWADLAKSRCAGVADAMVKRPQGTIDTTSPAAQAAVGDALYNPTSLQNATPELNAQILRTTAMFADPATGPRANAVLGGMGAPKPGAASTLVRGALGKDPTAAVDANDARVAVVAAMLKPVDQASVGSCFATGPARKLRQSDPIAVMSAYGEIATKGTYSPPGGPSVPAVTTIAQDEDPVGRSFEYSLATAAARDGNTREKQRFTAVLDGGLDQLKDAAVSDTFFLFKSWDWDKKKKALQKGIQDEFTFNYDSTLSITNTGDGSSSQGRYVIQRKSTGKEIKTEQDFKDQMAEVAIAAFGMKPSSKEAGEVRAAVARREFINAVCPTGYKPWELPGGGFPDEASKTLTGKTPSTTTMIDAKSGSDGSSEGTRTTALLSSIVNRLGASPTTMVPVTTDGQNAAHAFNLLPNDPSLADLKGANPRDTARKVQANLLDKGAAIANTELAPDRAAWLFDQAIEKAAAAETDNALKARIMAGARANRPRAAMKPGGLQAAIDAALTDYQNAKTDAETATWTQKETAAGHPPTPQAIAEQKRKAKAAKVAATATGTKNAMIREMGAPEFTVADTNWGGAISHTYFVVVPDPVTGAPRLWQKTEPPGDLAPMDPNWVNCNWQIMQ